MKKFAITFMFFTMACWLLASLGYMMMVQIIPDGEVFGTMIRMFLYHFKYPYQYIFVVAVAYGLVATTWCKFFGDLCGWKRVVSILMVMPVTILIASVPGGLLWEVHNVQAGFMPPLPVLYNNMIWAATAGLKLGWLIIALSIPYNIIGFITGFAITHYGQRLVKSFLSKHNSSKESLTIKGA